MMPLNTIAIIASALIALAGILSSAIWAVAMMRGESRLNRAATDALREEIRHLANVVDKLDEKHDSTVNRVTRLEAAAERRE